ncbi:MAG: hypothetical protein U1F71_03480 [Verrucomicrobiaceae bacterium]
MSAELANFRKTAPGNFQTNFTTEDGHQIDVTVCSNAASLNEDAVAFACGYLTHEMKFRRQAAREIFAKYGEMRDELGYASDEDLFKALEPGELIVRWFKWPDAFMEYLSPLDDLELWGDKHVILVRFDSYEGKMDEPKIILEQVLD